MSPHSLFCLWLGLWTLDFSTRCAVDAGASLAATRVMTEDVFSAIGLNYGGVEGRDCQY